MKGAVLNFRIMFGIHEGRCGEMFTYWGQRSAHADPVCGRSAYAEALFCQHCPGQEILIYRTACTALKQRERRDFRTPETCEKLT